MRRVVLSDRRRDTVEPDAWAASRRAAPQRAAPSRGAVTGLFGLLAALLVVACLSLVACGADESEAEPPSPTGVPGPDGMGKVVATSDGAGTYIDITPDELAAMLQNKDFLFINTHIPYEGEIEQTDLFIPFDEAAEQLSRLPADKAAKIVVYCRSDRMSRIAIEAWVRAGYTNLYNLDGGFVAWERAGYELLQK